MEITHEEEEDQVEEIKSVHIKEASIVQMLKDEDEGRLYEVVGGFKSDKLTQPFEIRLKTSGEFYFKLLNHPKVPPLLKVTVLDEEPMSFRITEHGFEQTFIKICKLKKILNLKLF